MLKPMVTPTRRAVDYLKHTWRRVTKSPKAGIYHLQMPSLLALHRPGGACMDRTQLNDVVDDDDLTIIHSNLSHDSSTISSNQLPTIHDSDWRHFADTPMRSSPSTFLGPWLRNPNRPSQKVRTRSSSGLTAPFSIESVHSAENKCDIDELEVFYSHCATPPTTSAPNTTKKESSLHHREISEEDNSNRASIANPTLAIGLPTRTLYRRASDSVIGEATISDLDKSTRAESESSLRPGPVSAVASDRWSFISVRGEGTTNDLLQYAASGLVANKRHEVFGKENPARVTTKRDERQENISDTPRTHPRYSGAYSLELNRRMVNTAHGPAVFMGSSFNVKV